ncbi:protein-disulfide isomerase [Melghirimyces profundicolus]|uniref:Protein-disulfide isomerase n=1 Tax=Melghirimyces profundicolus TaxID=1242148 RepID=A0A2T6C7Q1_9BACL|nr:thioredoxin domain-containing protein [Melghirimyces profundicolus]PTX64335.1 protein-disulfide isomerase [Melghirimyces profundicolus]
MAKKKTGQSHKQKKKQVEARSDRMQTLTLVTVILLFLGLGIFALVDSFIGGEEVKQGDGGKANVDEAIFAYDKQPVRGNPDAKVRIVEFGDYKCPVCKRFKDEIFPKLKKDFLDTDKAGFYFINNPFIGEDSVTAGIAGEAVYEQDPDAFWKFYHAVYDNQGPEKETWATQEFLVDLAKKEIPGVDRQKLKQAIEDRKYEDAVQQDRQIAAKAGVTSVPTLFINGKPVPNTFDYDQIRKMIEEELEK